jgi:redox-sensitive bicupin YhaK (pirin superfamily)
MEILSYVLAGSLEHEDSMGTGSIIRPGDVQRMSAGTGVAHSEYNGSKTEPVHFLQIWIIPAAPGGAPGYEQKSYAVAERRGRLRLLASPDGEGGSVTLRQDARLHGALLDGDERVRLPLAPGRGAWIQVARGSLRLGDHAMVAGDGAALVDEPAVELSGGKDAEVLVFDLA